MASALPLPSNHRVGPASPGVGAFVAGSLSAAAVLAPIQVPTSGALRALRARPLDTEDAKALSGPVHLGCCLGSLLSPK